MSAHQSLSIVHRARLPAHMASFLPSSYDGTLPCIVFMPCCADLCPGVLYYALSDLGSFVFIVCIFGRVFV